MEKKDKKQRDIVLSQDNALTTARYKFDLIENVPYTPLYKISGRNTSRTRTADGTYSMI